MNDEFEYVLDIQRSDEKYSKPVVGVVTSLGLLRIAKGECNCQASDDNPYQ